MILLHAVFLWGVSSAADKLWLYLRLASGPDDQGAGRAASNGHAPAGSGHGGPQSLLCNGERHLVLIEDFRDEMDYLRCSPALLRLISQESLQ